MRTRLHLKLCHLLSFGLFVSCGWALISCTPAQNQAETATPQVTETSVMVEASLTPLAPTSTLPVATPFMEEPLIASPTLTLTRVITTPTLINIEVPLETENLPAYGWFSENSQVVYFAYPEEGFTFSYDIAAQQLISTTLSQKSDEELIEQITPDLPPDARVVSISPKYQHIFYTIPISETTILERGAFTVALDDELWLYKESGSTRLGAVDTCFLINLPYALWSPSENFVAVNAFASMACAWSNWIIDLESYSVTSIDEAWEEGISGFSIVAILPDKQLLLTAFLKDEPSAILDLQTQELTVLSNRGNEIVKYLDDTIILDFIVWPGDDREETEIGFSPLNETARQLIGTTEGWIRAKHMSPDQKHVLLFSGSPDYYGLFEGQKTSGVWLLSFP